MLATEKWGELLKFARKGCPHSHLMDLLKLASHKGGAQEFADVLMLIIQARRLKKPFLQALLGKIVEHGF